MYKVRMKKKHWNFPLQFVSKILMLPCFFWANLFFEVVVVSTLSATYVDYLDKSWEAWPMKAQDGRWNAMNLICILRCSMFHAFYVSWCSFFSTEMFKIVASWGLNKYINDIDMQRQSGRSDAVAGSEFCRVPFESFQIHIGTLTHRHIDTFTTSIGWHVEITRHQTAWMALACYGGRWQALVASDFRMSNFVFCRQVHEVATSSSWLMTVMTEPLAFGCIVCILFVFFVNLCRLY